MIPRRLPLLVLVAVLAACSQQRRRAEAEQEFADLGHVDADHTPPPGVVRPIVPGDLAALQQRGRLLFDMSRALELGIRDGAARVGYGEGEVVLPIVKIDPGSRSAEVVFLRWRPNKVGPGGAVVPSDAERWLRVSLLLSPDRVLDVELLAGGLAEKSDDAAIAYAIIVAAEALRERTPGEAYGMFAVLEQISPRRDPTIRVYALAASDAGADFEILVELPERTVRIGRAPSERPRVTAVERVHGVGELAQAPARIERNEPGAAAVARVMQRGPDTVDVVVHTPSGRFRISPREGRIVREPTMPPQSNAGY